MLGINKAGLPNQFSGDGGITMKAPMNSFFIKQILLRLNYQIKSVFQQIACFA